MQSGWWQMWKQQQQWLQTISTDGEDASADCIGKLFVVSTERWVTCPQVHNSSKLYCNKNLVTVSLYTTVFYKQQSIGAKVC